MKLRVACLATVAAADHVMRRRDPPWIVIGLLDEPAHLATAGLVALKLRKPRRWNAAFLAGSLLPDIDHIPLVLKRPEPGDPRPNTHSLFVVAPVAALSPPLAAGMLAHLARDLAFGPGVPLLWPLRRSHVKVPYAAYSGALTVLAVLPPPRG